MTLETMDNSKKLFLAQLVFLVVLYIVIGEKYGRFSVRDWTQPVKSVFSSKENNDQVLLNLVQAINKSNENLVDGDDNEQFKSRLPSCLIIGSKKSGTGALRTFLNIHPEIKVAHGEPHFFDKDSNYEKGFVFYRSKMPKSYPHQITLEKSPSYLISEQAMKRIFDFNSSIKLIVILRHPVKRMISDFWHDRRRHRNDEFELEELCFDNKTGEVNETYAPVNISLYHIHIKRYLEYFPRHQLHVVDGDNFIVNPSEEISKIETFLGLEHFVTKDKVYFDKEKKYFCYIKDSAKHCLSPSKGHTHPPLAKEYFKRLRDFFDPFNRKLYKLIGKEFKWN